MLSYIAHSTMPVLSLSLLIIKVLFLLLLIFNTTISFKFPNGFHPYITRNLLLLSQNYCYHCLIQDFMLYYLSNNAVFKRNFQIMSSIANGLIVLHNFQ